MINKKRILGSLEKMIHHSHYLVFTILILFQFFLPSIHDNILDYYYDCEPYVFTFVTVFFSIIFAIYLSIPNKKIVKQILGRNFYIFTKFLSTMFLCSIIFISLVALVPDTYAEKWCLFTNIKFSLFASFFLNTYRIVYIIKKLNEITINDTSDDVIVELNNKLSRIESYVSELYNKSN